MRFYHTSTRWGIAQHTERRIPRPSRAWIGPLLVGYFLALVITSLLQLAGVS